MGLARSSLRVSSRPLVRAAGVAVMLVLSAACGGSAAAPTPTAVPTTPAGAIAVPSPQRPALASPIASPSAPAASVPASSPTSAASAVDSGGGETYVVQAGDTLASIAQDKYGESAQWQRIYDANKDAIGADPDKLKLGASLKIPPKQP